MRAGLILVLFAGCSFDPEAIIFEEDEPAEPGADPGALAPESPMARVGDHGAPGTPETDPPGLGEPCSSSSEHDGSWDGDDFDHGRRHGHRNDSSDCGDGCGEENDSCAPYGLVCDHGYCGYP